MANKPNDQTTMVSQMIGAAIDRLAPRKTQKELAREMGFVRGNMLSMLRTGAAKVPFGRIPNIAGVLGIDPAVLLRWHLAENWPEFEDVIFEIFGGILTADEKDWIEFFAEVGMPSPPSDGSQRLKLIEILQKNEWEEDTP